MGQRQSYRSRVSTVLGLVLGFLGLVMLAVITPAARAVTPSRVIRTDVLEMRPYIGAWLAAFNAAGMRRISGTLEAQRDARSPAPLGTGGDALAPASLCSRDLLAIAQGCSRGWRGARERCCCKAEPMAAIPAQALPRRPQMRNLCHHRQFKYQGGAQCAVTCPLPSQSLHFLAILALAVMFMVSVWTRTHAEMSVHGWIALTLGVFFSLIVGCGLMMLVFYSSRRGYDERAHAAQSHREVP